MVKANAAGLSLPPSSKPMSRRQLIAKDFKKYKSIYLMMLPIVTLIFVFSYIPMNGVVIAFQRYNLSKGIFKSQFVGFDNFRTFMGSFYFGRLMRNTFLISFYGFLFGFPAPILLALLLNEIKNKAYKRTIQTITYLPHFISMVVICGIVRILLKQDGIINYIITQLGGSKIFFLADPAYYRTIHIASGIWQNVGYNSIIYLGAISSLGSEIYEAALIDGAGRWKQAIRLTIPGLIPTISILFIFNMSGLLNVGAEKILLLYSASIYETADVLSTYIYRVGIAGSSMGGGGQYGLAAAVGLFNSVISMILLIATNQLARKAGGNSLW